MNENRATPHARIYLLICICLAMATLAAAMVASLSADVSVSTGGVLVDGGILNGPDGLLIGTVTGTLTSPLQVTITQVTAPATALDPGITPVGNFYDIQADRDLYTPSDHPLLIGLPVADGVSPLHLAMAVLIPPERIPFANDGLPHWSLFRGAYEALDRRLVVTLGGLSASGYQVVLVDAPNQTPLGMPTSDLSVGIARAGSGSVASGAPITYTIAITNAGPTTPVTATVTATWSPAAAVSAAWGPGCAIDLVAGTASCTATGVSLASIPLPNPHLVLTTTATYTGSLSASAAVSLVGEVSDVYPGNNSAGPIQVTIVPPGPHFVVYLPIILAPGVSATTASQLSPQAHLASFEVLCSSSYSAGQCGAAQTDKVAVELSKAYDEFQDQLKFNLPHLFDRYGGFNPLAFFLGYHSYYNIFLVPPPGSNCILEGQYVADGYVEICVPRGSSITPYDVETIRHEYFHATQYGYDKVLDQPTDKWITDGTAVAAQRSLITMTRSLHYDLHKVDIPITDPSDEHRYPAQDFFVFVGQKQGKGIDYLIPLFDDWGAQTQDVVDALGDGTHLPIYWEWAKNQAIEKTIDFDKALQDPCSLEAGVVTHIDPWHFDHTKLPTHDVGMLEPLNSIVVGVIWDGSYEIAEGTVYPTADPNDTAALQALRYKFYRDGEQPCKDIPDGRRLFDEADGEISPDNFYWVLISNIHPTKSYAYTVRFEVHPLPPS